MNNNFEAIKSLVSLLVKKAGFDINSNYSEEELAKTKESIGARIENKEIIIKEEVIEEPISEEATVSVENAAEEAPAVTTETTVVEEVADTVKEENVETVKEENK